LTIDRTLVDTNILTAVRDEDYAKHGSVLRFLREFEGEICIAPQSLYEYWVVSTRPKEVNGLGLSTEETWNDIADFRQTFKTLIDPPELLDVWLALCRRFGVSGKPAHDARLAAYARCYGIETLVTLNARDFARYGLNVVVP
jgi:predicted nucleic acid-binding protein